MPTASGAKRRFWIIEDMSPFGKRRKTASSRKMLDEGMMLEGFRRFDLYEDCKDAACQFSLKVTHYHCTRENCGYKFCGRTHMYKHAQHHDRVDNLVLDDFKRFKASLSCHFADCPFSGTSTHFHCLRCRFRCTDSTKVTAHRKHHGKQDVISAAGFCQFSSSADCAVPDCKYKLKCSHFHCTYPGCRHTVVGMSQMDSHKRKHEKQERGEPPAASPSPSPSPGGLDGALALGAEPGGSLLFLQSAAAGLGLALGDAGDPGPPDAAAAASGPKEGPPVAGPAGAAAQAAGESSQEDEEEELEMQEEAEDDEDEDDDEEHEGGAGPAAARGRPCPLCPPPAPQDPPQLNGLIGADLRHLRAAASLKSKVLAAGEAAAATAPAPGAPPATAAAGPGARPGASPARPPPARARTAPPGPAEAAARDPAAARNGLAEGAEPEDDDEQVRLLSSALSAGCSLRSPSGREAEPGEDRTIRYVRYESELQMPDIMRLITKDLSEPYSIYTYRYFIHNWPQLCFLAMVGEECVGAIVCKLDMHKKMFRRGYIAMLAVDSKYRRNGIGTNLVKKAIYAMVEGDCDEVVLETEITNKSALKLYENLGFVRDKRLFRYYLNGVDALRLKLWLR
ncbi:PREDICTED: N-alpha-acetyltransferase 30 [Chinchilla lanigera]|nr:PREDICTED: N-alpha-acetyltransferase 30 [Chinchilla lanigera]